MHSANAQNALDAAQVTVASQTDNAAALVSFGELGAEVPIRDRVGRIFRRGELIGDRVVPAR